MFDFTEILETRDTTHADITLHSVVRYCHRFLNTEITEAEIHRNSKGNWTKNFDTIIKAYDDIRYYLKHPAESAYEGIRLVVRDNTVTTIMKV